MHRIAAVAVNTFREAVRDRILLGMIGMALLILIFTLALAELSLHQERRIVLDLGLASISLFSALVSIFLGSSLLYKEIERKTLYVILPKPIRRYEFLLGKCFGIVLTVSVFVFIMGAVQFWVTSVQAGGTDWMLGLALVGLPLIAGLAAWKARDRTAILFPSSVAGLVVCALLAAGAGVELLPILCALALIIGEVLLVTSVALLFSSFSTPFLTALFTLGVWVAGRSADFMASMRSKALPEQIRVGMKVLAEIVPNFNLFVPGRHTLETQIDAVAGPLSYVGTTLAYTALYSAILLMAAALLFRRRDFL
jgi:ABC-type transport system involved in multi-copper enzyme maturation permease subunit